MADVVEVVEVDDEEFDIIDTATDVVGIGLGLASGAVVGAVANQVVPIAENVGENILRWGGIIGLGIWAEEGVAKAVRKNVAEVRSFLHGLTKDDDES